MKWGYRYTTYTSIFHCHRWEEGEQGGVKSSGDRARGGAKSSDEPRGGAKSSSDIDILLSHTSMSKMEKR